MEKDLYPDFVICDSGLGGLPFYKALKNKLPDASIVYVCDKENFPYGTKSPLEITDLSIKFISEIEKKYYPKNLIVACNTISLTAGREIASTFNYWNKIILTVPPIKKAMKTTKNKRIGVLATQATLNSSLFNQLLHMYSGEYKFITRADPDLVSFIEHNFRGSTIEERQAAITPAIEFFKNTDCDVVILGCTHFLNMRDDFIKCSEKAFTVVDSLDDIINLAVDVYNKDNDRPY